MSKCAMRFSADSVATQSKAKLATTFVSARVVRAASMGVSQEATERSAIFATMKTVVNGGVKDPSAHGYLTKWCRNSMRNGSQPGNKN